MWIKIHNLLAPYLSKEASLADWLAGIGTILVAVIALWPSISNLFSRKLFPKIKLSISGRSNIVISGDGKIHKLQIPYQIENEGISRGYIEEMQVAVEAINQKYELPWRKFIFDVSGSATAPISNPYRFKIDPKEVIDKFIEYLTEDNINFELLEYQVTTTVIIGYGGKSKRIQITKVLKVDQKIQDEISKNSALALKNGRPVLVSVNIA